MFGQLIGQPVQTLVQTRALSGTGGLGVPLRRHTDRQVNTCTGDITTHIRNQSCWLVGGATDVALVK